jgi:hypothetical protein
VSHYTDIFRSWYYCCSMPKCGDTSKAVSALAARGTHPAPNGGRVFFYVPTSSLWCARVTVRRVAGDRMFHVRCSFARMTKGDDFSESILFRQKCAISPDFGASASDLLVRLVRKLSGRSKRSKKPVFETCTMGVQCRTYPVSLTSAPKGTTT